jgi:hypothetical protein
MRTLAVVALTLAVVASAEEPKNAREAAELYLKALTGGDGAGKDELLGGATMTAQIFTLENWKVLSEDPVRHEKGDLSQAVKLMRDLDASGKATLKKIAGGGGGTSTGEDDMQTQTLTAEQTEKIMGPTQAKADRFKKTYPVLAYVARVGKTLYWHPQNPIRPLLVKTGGKGPYELEVHRYVIESVEGASKSVRHWPLRVLRLTAGDLDTGWKVLPASDWNAD